VLFFVSFTGYSHITIPSELRVDILLFQTVRQDLSKLEGKDGTYSTLFLVVFIANLSIQQNVPLYCSVHGLQPDKPDSVLVHLSAQRYQYLLTLLITHPSNLLTPYGLLKIF